jgi:hypothetical protein
MNLDPVRTDSTVEAEPRGAPVVRLDVRPTFMCGQLIGRGCKACLLVILLAGCSAETKARPKDPSPADFFVLGRVGEVDPGNALANLTRPLVERSMTRKGFSDTGTLELGEMHQGSRIQLRISSGG